MVLVLYETALGFCLFKMTDESKISNSKLYQDFETPEGAASLYVDAPTLADRIVGLIVY